MRHSSHLLSAACASAIAARIISSGGNPPGYRRQERPEGCAPRAAGSMSSPLIRMVGEPRNPIAFAVRSSLTSISRISAESPSRAATSRTRRTAGSWFGQPGKYRISVFMILSPARAPARFVFRKDRARLRFRLHRGRKRPGALPQAGYEPLLDFFKMPDLAAHLADLAAKLLTDLRTRFHLALQIQQLPNLGQREAESLRLLDEFQVFDVVLGEQSEAPVGSNRTMEQHLFLVEAYGVR